MVGCLFAAMPQSLGFWPYATGLIDMVLALLATGHAVLSKRDTRAAIGWVGLIWLVPLLGVVLYLWLGINRIERRARSLRADRPRPASLAVLNEYPSEIPDEASILTGTPLEPLVRLVRDVTGQPLLAGNRVTPLIDGDQAYPAMLQAIDEASRSITLTTYLFNHDPAGEQFVEALERAVLRHVEVRVLVDYVGAHYHWRPIAHRLRQAAIPYAQFLPTLIPWQFQYSNLRNHRKILVVDGRVGFTGGINIHEENCLLRHPRHPVQDLHFRLDGPVVAQLQAVFADDWAFCTGELLEGESWFPVVEWAGPVLARGIPSGPDDDFETLRLTLLGAMACARSSIVVVSPYFLPDAALIAALNVASLRGVRVDIILPAVNDLKLVQWASTALLWQVLERGCHVWISPPPFDHTKLMLVDNRWTLLGSANWDPRSLRLNFEFNVECHDRDLATSLTGLVESKIQQSRQLTLADVDGRSLPRKLRDGVARLFSPYL